MAGESRPFSISGNSIKMNSKMPVQEKFYHNLKKEIIYGELSPVEKLSEVELMKRMKVSRTPIREVIKQLFQGSK
jgi:DNA-binding GntR family transcriptional regulator